MHSLVFIVSRSTVAAVWREASVNPPVLCGCRRLVYGGRAGGGKKQLPPSITLLEGDLEEKFVKGSGPGGQKINKVRNCVQLTHKPTGISVACQDARELHINRGIARTRLREKVEFHMHGEDSKTGRRIAKIRNRKARSQRKSRIKHQAADLPSHDTDGSLEPPRRKAVRTNTRDSDGNDSGSDDYSDDDCSEEEEGEEGGGQ